VEVVRSLPLNYICLLYHINKHVIKNNQTALEINDAPLPAIASCAAQATRKALQEAGTEV
jgi:hypothetical protein